MKTYAAYDENGIWETGSTPDEALARFYAAAQATPDEISPLDTAPMTDRLAARIESQGFDANRDLYVILPDGTLDLPREDGVHGLYLVALGDIANLAGVEKDTVAKWIMRHSDFPAPFAATSAGKIWERADIEAWLKATGRL